MFNLFYKNFPLQGSLAAILVIATIFSAGVWVLLEPKPVHATGLPVIDIAAIATAVWNGIKFAAKWAWEKVEAAYNAAANWITAGIKAWEKGETILARATYAAAQIALHMLLNMLTNDIIKWIQGGGEPRFISDWEGFLKNAGNKAGGLFVDKYLGANYLCEPFDVAIKIPLRKVETFQEKVKCTLEDMGINIRMFLDEFKIGGWMGWIELTKPQGNFYGGYLIAQTEKINREEAAKDAAGQEGGAGRGFLSVKVCVKGKIIDNYTSETYSTCNNTNDCKTAKESVEGDMDFSFDCEKEIVSTPASVLSDVTSRAMDREMDNLSRQVADLTDSLGVTAPYIIAISNALINRMMEEGLAEVQGTGPTEEEPDIPMPGGTVVTPTDTPARAEADVDNAVILSEQQELLKENLEIQLLPQQQSNLSVMQDIRTIQSGILSTLSRFLCPGCSLPYWANNELISTRVEFPPDVPVRTTIETFQITGADIGSILFEKRTWVERVCSGEGECEDVTFCDKNNLETNKQISGQITDLEQDITSTNQWIADIDTAITSTEGFIDAVDEYVALYDATPQPPTQAEQDALDDKKDAVAIAKELLINNGQIITLSSEETEDIYQLVLDIRNSSREILDITNGLLEIRGASADHSAGDTLYAQKRSLQGTFNQVRSDLSDCINPPEGNE